jgi:hypothetical protein
MVTGAVVLPAEFDAVIVYTVVAVALMAVPLITPVVVFSTMPAGSGGVALYEVTAPPVLVGLFAVIGTPWT